MSCRGFALAFTNGTMSCVKWWSASVRIEADADVDVDADAMKYGVATVASQCSALIEAVVGKRAS